MTMNTKVFSSSRRIITVIPLFVILLTLPFVTYSQSVSVNTTGAPPNPSAGLDVNFTNKGFLIPRVSLTSTASSAPLAAHVAGMFVYNLATVGDVTPGFYYDNGTRWIRFIMSGSTVGTMLYWNGTKWTLLPPGTAGQRLQLDASNIPVWK